MNTLKEIIYSWKQEIEEININGYQRKISSLDCFQMNKYYSGYPRLSNCYKVNFEFEDGFSPYNPCSEIILESKEMSKNREEWNKELERLFILKFGEPVSDNNYTNIKFENDICDYFVYQGYRFIIQFYLPGVISKLREDKIKQILKT